MGDWTLVLGGARSGKSSFAQKIVEKKKGAKVLYLASAVPFDDEMKQRIKLHQEKRPLEWQTLEAPYDAHDPLREFGKEKGVILWDCLTLYLNNLIYQETEIKNNHDFLMIEKNIEHEVERLIALKKEGGAQWVVVSNEVGYGIVPEHKLSRLFRDCAGRANQRFAEICDHVYLVTAGIPTKLK